MKKNSNAKTIFQITKPFLYNLRMSYGHWNKKLINKF